MMECFLDDIISNTFVVTGNHVSQYGKVSLTTIQMSRYDFSNVKGMNQFSNFPLSVSLFILESLHKYDK